MERTTNPNIKILDLISKEEFIMKLRFWHASVGANLVPADTKRKTFKQPWAEFQERAMSEQEFEENLKNGAYEDGCAIITGKVWRGQYKGKQLACVDCDNLLAIQEVYNFAGISYSDFEKGNLIEAHEDDPHSRHVFFITDRVVKAKTKSVGAGEDKPHIEVKSGGKFVMFCDPSIHGYSADDSRPDKIYSQYRMLRMQMPAMISKVTLETHIQKICDKYGLTYLDKKESNANAKSKIKDKWTAKKGERHVIFLEFCHMMIGSKRAKFSKEVIRELCYQQGQTYDPPMEPQEMEREFEDAWIFQEEKGEPEAETEPESEAETEPESEPKESKKESEKKTKKKEEEKTPHIIGKYHDKKNRVLYESVMIDDTPVFAFVQDDKIKITDKFQLKDNGPYYIPLDDDNTLSSLFRFGTYKDFEWYWNESANITIGQLYNMSKTIWSKYVYTSKHYLSICAADTIYTYFQDKIGPTHYLYIIGDNETGKTAYENTMEQVCYRPYTSVSFSDASHYRSLGNKDEGQVTMIHDETNKLSELSMRLNKTGYKHGGFVKKVDEIGGKQVVTRYFTFCFKMFASETTPTGEEAKGFNERCFHIVAVKGNPDIYIHEITEESNREYFADEISEIERFKKLMFMFRLRHYHDKLKYTKTNIKNRDRELTIALITLFRDTDVQDEIIEALDKMLRDRRGRTQLTLEAQIFKTLVFFIENPIHIRPDQKGDDNDPNHLAIPFNTVFEKLKETVDGEWEKFGENESRRTILTDDYGKITTLKVSKILADRFYGQRGRKELFKYFVFRKEQLERLKSGYASVEPIKILND